MNKSNGNTETPSSNPLHKEQVVEQTYLSLQKDLEHWFQSSLGRTLLASQRQYIEQAVKGCFGFHQAEIGVSHRVPVGNLSQLGHRFYVLPEWVPELPDNCVISRSEDIALEHDVADLVLLHHALDFSTAPHQTLREASRILKPSGHLVIIGFNPLSSWGLRKALSPNSRTGAPWRCRFIAGRRVEDWLELLDFKVASLNYHLYAPPFNHQRLINRFKGLDNVLNAKVPLGAYYIISAQKQVGSRVKRARKWRNNPKVVGLPMANRSDINKQ
jgi:SAM-dependent methyltransferase